MTDPRAEEGRPGGAVRVRAVGPVLQVTLDRPHKRNAVDPAMTLGLEAAFARLEADPDLRVCVLAAAGDFFCAGSDLVLGAGPHTADGGQYGMIRRSRTKPLVAAVDGPALGGGFEMVLAADLVVASCNAWFALPEGARGRLPGAGGLMRAPARLPRNVAVEMMLTGARLDAARAYDLGLVNRLVEPGAVLRTAFDLALDAIASAPESVAQILRGLERIEEPGEELGWGVTAEAMDVVRGSSDHTEGTAAFVERRPPRWGLSAAQRAAIVGAATPPPAGS
ncbi:enoyl-CoA hydratase/isomerase family protein [Rhodococcus pseudokoreensis]|uniref:Enoyl-CoA hydratase/isomerase family protein n=1 Tax=Rhodococcus pseudokoreensis TaxID=2811421 RepID=A0A974VZ13_9NOCA|nr:enoyl-CoA hydratase-related protein [Rhodococcus pseudokoreensis]QSE88193.1 enoyl-CoA hydratase/isomerase family protein [Rhodococcus pseudokoreensis]